MSKLEPVHVATSEGERDAVFRFRYAVYYEELGRRLGEPDHERRWVRDADDDDAATTILYTGSPEAITGTLRLRHWPAGAVPTRVVEELSMDRFPDLQERATAEIGRFMIDPNERGRLIAASLTTRALERLCDEHGTELVFCYGPPAHVNLYRKLGMRPFGGRLVQTADDAMIPLVCVTSDVEHFRAVRSPLAFLVRDRFGDGSGTAVDVEAYRSLFEVGASAVQADAEPLWEEIQEAIASNTTSEPSFLDSLPAEAVRQLTRRGVIMDVAEGTMLIRKGLRQQEMFVVLDGFFQATDGDRVLATLARGDLFGELAFFEPDHRRTANVTCVVSGRILALQADTLRELVRSDSDTAAHVLLKICEVMAARIAATNRLATR